MVSNRPYGDIQIVKGYCSNIKLQETTYTKLMDRAATDIEGAFKMAGSEFPTDYVYYNTIKSLVELKAACYAHLSFGLRQDAAIYCKLVTDGLAELKVEDVSLETDTSEGTMEPLIPETYPANPVGHRLEGRTNPNSTGSNYVPTP